MRAHAHTDAAMLVCVRASVRMHFSSVPQNAGCFYTLFTVFIALLSEPLAMGKWSRFYSLDCHVTEVYLGWFVAWWAGGGHGSKLFFSPPFNLFSWTELEISAGRVLNLPYGSCQSQPEILLRQLKSQRCNHEWHPGLGPHTHHSAHYSP